METSFETNVKNVIKSGKGNAVAEAKSDSNNGALTCNTIRNDYEASYNDGA